MWLGFGVYSVTGMYGRVGRGEARQLVEEALGLGIDFLDTADVYGRGLGEELLRGLGDRAFIATKVGYRLDTERPAQCFSEECLLRAVEASRRRLGVETIDLVQVHNPPLEVLRRGEVYRAMRRMKELGLARLTGVALGPETDVLEHGLEALSRDEVDAIQFVYNMLEQEPGYTLAREARSRGVMTIVRVPHAGGVLDESVKPGEEKAISDHRSLRRRGWYRWAFRVYYGEVKPLLDPLPGTPGQKALRFIEQSIDPDVVVLIARSVDRLREYAGYASIPPLPGSVVEELHRVYVRHAAGSPEAPRSLDRCLLPRLYPPEGGGGPGEGPEEAQ